MIKRWPKRREFLSYYALYRVFGCKNSFNLGEAVDILAPILGGKNIATRLVKRLVKQGFLERIKPLTYRAKCIEELLDEALSIYFAKRLRRRGYNAWPCNGKVCIYCQDEECSQLESHPLLVVSSSSSS